MRITKAGIGLIFTAIMSVVIGRIFGMTELFLLTGMCLAAILLSGFYALFASPKLDIQRRTKPAKLRSRNEAQLVLELNNEKKTPSPILYAVDTIAGRKNVRLTFGSIPSNESLKIGYSTPELQRGILEVGPLELSIQDPLGLVQKNLKVDSSTTYLVRPQFFELAPITASSGRLKTTHKRSRTKKPGDDEFYALRPYVVGDDLRKVNWRAAARSDNLLIRQDRETQLGAVTIVLDSALENHTPESFERAISATTSILHSAYKGGDLVKYYSSESPTSHTLDTEEELDSIEKQLSLLKPDPNADVTKILEVLSRRSVGGSLVMIIGSANDKNARAIENCRLRHRQIITICCNTPTNAKWVIPYDGRTPLPLVWSKALAVSTK